MNCDPLARWYRWLEYAGFGRALERRRLEFLPRLVHARKILVLGEGDGRFLAALLRINRTAEVDYVDDSGEMLALARRRAQIAEGTATGEISRVRFHRGDAAAWLGAWTPGGYDAICTHFFLDCFAQDQLESLVRGIARHAAVPACWIVSEFRYPDTGPARFWGRVFIRMLYEFFQVSTGLRVRRLPEHGRAIEAAGFHRVRRVIAGLGILESELWESSPPGGLVDAAPGGFCV